MRVALLSTLEPATDMEIARGFLRVGGRTVLEHQLAAAAAFGCGRVLCLADGFAGKLRPIQRAAERRGMAFAAVADGHDLVGLVAPDDEVLVLASGLLAPADELVELAGAAPTIVVQPADRGLAAGFERIDLHHAEAGVMHMPGALLGRLAQLPREWHPGSALLRIAAQAGLPQRSLPEGVGARGPWTLVCREADARAAERRWLRPYTAARPWAGLGDWLAAQVVQWIGPRLLHAGRAPRWVSLAAVTMAAGGGALGWAGFAIPAFVVLALAWVAYRGGELLVRIVRDPSPATPRNLAVSAAIGWLLDAVLALCITRRLDGPGDAALPWPPAGLVALTLVLLARLVVQLFPDRAWTPWFEDRWLAGLALAAAAATNLFTTAVLGSTLLTVVFVMSMLPPRRVDAAAGEGNSRQAMPASPRLPCPALVREP